MKLTRLLVLLFAAFAAISNDTHAQSINSENLKQVKVDELSDAEIRAYYQKASNAGLSEEQLYKLALERGMPEAEISKLKRRMAALSVPENTSKEKKNDSTSDRGNGNDDSRGGCGALEC